MRTDAQARNDGKDKFVLRFDDDSQRAELKARAALNRRTMNAEVLFLIDKGLEAVKATNAAR